METFIQNRQALECLLNANIHGMRPLQNNIAWPHELGCSPNKTALIQLCYGPKTPAIAKLLAARSESSSVHHSAAIRQDDDPSIAELDVGQRTAGEAMPAPCVDLSREGADCHCLLLHVAHSGVPPVLRKILESSSLRKAGVNITGDAHKLRSDFGVGRRIRCCVVRLDSC